MHRVGVVPARPRRLQSNRCCRGRPCTDSGAAWQVVGKYDPEHTRTAVALCGKKPCKWCLIVSGSSPRGGLHTRGVAGSIPAAPITKRLHKRHFLSTASLHKLADAQAWQALANDLGSILSFLPHALRRLKTWKQASRFPSRTTWSRQSRVAPRSSSASSQQRSATWTRRRPPTTWASRRRRCGRRSGATGRGSPTRSSTAGASSSTGSRSTSASPPAAAHPLAATRSRASRRHAGGVERVDGV
jgi:hypothetical protein